MRAFPVSSESYSHPPAFLFLQAPPCIYITHSCSLLFSDPFSCETIPQTHQSFSATASPKLCSSSSKLRPFLCCTSKSDSTTNHLSFDVDDEEDDDVNLLLADGEVEEPKESITEDGVYIQVKKLEKNSRRIESRISIDAPLITVWNLLTDYERLVDFIPGLAVSQLLEKGDNYARLFQGKPTKCLKFEISLCNTLMYGEFSCSWISNCIGRQNLAFGLKFNAKGIVDCYEKELESFASGMKREIEFKMIEGDFKLFEGKWSILQSNSETCEESQAREFNTTLSYILDVKPKLWLPVRLVEDRLCNEIKINLASIREEARKAVHKVVHRPSV